MPRFYCPPPLPNSGTFTLPPEAAHHASRVLRLTCGESIEIFDGNGACFNAKISDISGKSVFISEIQLNDTKRESPLFITLAQALSSTEKMDFVVQKATELGVHVIQPLATERSMLKLSGERSEKRLEHWQKIAISACEQCGRNVLPQILPPIEIKTWIQRMTSEHATKLILMPDASASLRTLACSPQTNVMLLIGAEGGFAPHESDFAKQNGFTPIQLGQRVLRTETAAVAGISTLQTLWGDFC